MMGSGAEATEEAINYLNARGEKLGMMDFETAAKISGVLA